jgi:hypothetical protein
MSPGESLTVFTTEPWVKLVASCRPPDPCGGWPVNLEHAFIAEHHSAPFFLSPVFVLLAKTEPLLLHDLFEYVSWQLQDLVQ